jgi:hypothetical protein
VPEVQLRTLIAVRIRDEAKQNVAADANQGISAFKSMNFDTLVPYTGIKHLPTLRLTGTTEAVYQDRKDQSSRYI